MSGQSKLPPTLAYRWRSLAWICAISALPTPTALAGNLNGSWSTNRDECVRIFAKNGTQTRLTREADAYGSGFVIDGTTIRGKMATCKVTSRKQVGHTIHMRAACASDVSVINSTFYLKVVSDDEVVRSFPEIPELNTPYFRCP